MRAASRRWLVAMALALTVMGLGAGVESPARAHGGDLMFTGIVEPYLIRTFAVWRDGWLDYSIDLRNASTNASIPSAHVRVTAVTPNGTLGPWDALYTGNVYEVVEQTPERAAWTMRVDVDSALGRATFSHPLDLSPGNWVWLTGAVVLAFLGAVGAHMYVSRRRARRQTSRAG